VVLGELAQQPLRLVIAFGTCLGLNRGGLVLLLPQVRGAVLLVRQPLPLAGHVYQGVPGRPERNHVRELQTILRKLALNHLIGPLSF
jgi:hypothetical protein